MTEAHKQDLSESTTMAAGNGPGNPQAAVASAAGVIALLLNFSAFLAFLDPHTFGKVRDFFGFHPYVLIFVSLPAGLLAVGLGVVGVRMASKGAPGRRSALAGLVMGAFCVTLQMAMAAVLIWLERSIEDV